MKTTILAVAALCAGIQTIAQTAGAMLCISAGAMLRIVPIYIVPNYYNEAPLRDTVPTNTAGAILRIVPNLPNWTNLQHSIHQHYQQQLSAELAEFTESRKGAWMKYLPNVGTTYTLAQGAASGRSLWPTVSFNINTIYQARRDQQTREAKRRSIRQKIQLEEKKTLAAVRSMVTEYHIRLRELETQKLMLKIDEQLHAIQKDKYERSEIPPSEYLPAYKRWLQVQLAFRQMEDELVLLQGKILEAAFFWENDPSRQ